MKRVVRGRRSGERCPSLLHGPARTIRRPTLGVALLIAVISLACAGGARAATIHTAPTLPVNACHNSSLPLDYGTDFPTPADPYAFGFESETSIGWENNIYAPFEYLSGSYFARGVPTTYTDTGGTQLCGAMYSFGVYTYGLASGVSPAAGSVQWTEASGYLPAMTTSFTRNGVAISITDFADEQTINGGPVELVYTRVAVTNHNTASATVPPDASGPNLVSLTTPSDVIAPGATVDFDFVAATDTFSTTTALPTVAQITASASSYNAAYTAMVNYWNGRLAVAPTLSLPNVALPNTNGLASPGTALTDAYKAAFIYTRMVQSGYAPFSAADNYSYVLNHDAPGILMNRFELGDYQDAQSLLLNARTSETPGYDEHGANWYYDGDWRTPIAWAMYLEGTNDTAFVSQYFHDDATSSSIYGPSLYTMMHTIYEQQLTSAGYLGASDDNDTGGTWLFDDETALAGLAAYKYIATRIGNTTEATWADTAYTNLLNSVNSALAANEQSNDFAFLPCEVTVPITADRCVTTNDANWAGSNLWGQNVWNIFLQGGTLNGILGQTSQTDNLYETGYARLVGTGIPYPSFGAYPGYSVALNTAYANGALYGNAYRDLPITSYAWQIATTTSGPNAWWEADSVGPNASNPWAGSHASIPEFGASPYVWPMAGQTQTLLQSLVAPGLTATSNGSGGFTYTNDLYIGRGVPDAWIAPGQTVAVSNLTAAYNESTGARTTYGVKLATSTVGGATKVTITLSGTPPTGPVDVQLPIFADDGVASTTGGTYSASTHTLAMTGTTATATLGTAAKPALAVTVASDAQGTFTHPELNQGQATTASATITNTGVTALSAVTLSLSLPSGWTATATSATEFSSVAAGKSATTTWSVTPPTNTATGQTGAGVVVDANYTPTSGAAGAASAEDWVYSQPPLPLPAGTTNAAPNATPSASYTSPWATVDGINSGIYPDSSSDDDDETPYWGDYPDSGTSDVELDWGSAITTSSSEVYFADDGGGLDVPASWTVQYWNGSAWLNVANQSGDPTAINAFNTVTFTPVTTTKLRISMQSTGSASVGIVQWVVPVASSSSASARRRREGDDRAGGRGHRRRGRVR